jgi:hypothetical protein
VDDVIVWTTVQLPGLHHWPDAPARRAYLRNTHRHLFGVTVYIAVAHDNRAVEFHDLQDEVRAWWGPGVPDHGARSCETLARDLADALAQQGFTVAAVDVSEDGESGATVRVRS